MVSPKDPGLDGFISPSDENIAVSSPNAVVGSRLFCKEEGEYVPASFAIDSESLPRAGLQSSFTLHSFWLKPLDAPAPSTVLYVKGYRARSKQHLLWHVEFPSGYHAPLLVKVEEYSKEAWDNLVAVEIWADFGYDALDWEFAIDDLAVEYHPLRTAFPDMDANQAKLLEENQ